MLRVGLANDGKDVGFFLPEFEFLKPGVSNQVLQLFICNLCHMDQ